MKYLLLLILLSAGCAKDPEISATDESQKNGKTASNDNQLTVTFDDAAVIANRGGLVHQHILLNKKVNYPVTVTVTITDSTALYSRDFTGFVSGNSQSSSTVIEPGTLVGHFPKIAVTKNALCGGKFHLQLSADKNQLLELGEAETIQINCPE